MRVKKVFDPKLTNGHFLPPFESSRSIIAYKTKKTPICIEVFVYMNTIFDYFPSAALTSPLIFNTLVGVSALEITVIAFLIGPTRFVSYFT